MKFHGDFYNAIVMAVISVKDEITVSVKSNHALFQ